MKIFIITLILCLQISKVCAGETIYPKDLPRCERFDSRGLEIIQKAIVDQGHQPWRSDPEYYAKFFMNFLYPDLDPNEREKLPAELIYKDIKAIVKVIYNEREHLIYLRKVFPSNPESIWLVEKMIIK